MKKDSLQGNQTCPDRTSAYALNSPLMLPRISPIRLSRRPEPFDSDEFLYELKIDGFRALAHIADGKAN
jgi:ATP-dependent DNA ligase